MDPFSSCGETLVLDSDLRATDWDGSDVTDIKSCATFWSVEDPHPNGLLRYHLGQLSMLGGMQRILAGGGNVEALLCDVTDQLIDANLKETMTAGVHVAQRFISIAGDSGIRVGRLSERINDLDDEHLLEINQLTLEILSQLRTVIINATLDEHSVNSLVSYREYQSDLNLDLVSPAIKKLHHQIVEAMGCELEPSITLSAAYLLMWKASWAQGGYWLSDVTSYLGHRGKADKDFCILEANRNAYSWVTLGLLHKVAISRRPHLSEVSVWPKLILSPNLPAHHEQGYMQLSQPSGCIFLSSPVETIVGALSEDIIDNYCQWLNIPSQTSTSKRNALCSKLLEVQEKVEQLCVHKNEPTEVHVLPDIVLTLHGIRTTGKWQKQASVYLGKAEIKNEALDFDYFGAGKLLRPSKRDEVLQWFIGEYERCSKENGEISIVAHSFGTWIVTRALEMERSIKFNKLILCGSIVSENYDWTTVFDHGQVKHVRNECAARDGWVKVANKVMGDAAGLSGVSGFEDTANGLVENCKAEHHTHSSILNPIRFQREWVDYLKGT